MAMSSAIWAAVGSGLFGFYLFADVVWVMNPNNTNYGDYILGSMLIYVDIVRIFVYLLIMFARKDG